MWNNAHCVHAVSGESCARKHNIDFLFQLGDLVSAHSTLHDCYSSISPLLEALAQFTQPLFHLWGNQDLHCFLRTDLLRHPDLGWAIRHFAVDYSLNGVVATAGMMEALRFRVTSSQTGPPQLQSILQFPAYFSFELGVQTKRHSEHSAFWRFIALDTFEVAHVGYKDWTEPFEKFNGLLKQAGQKPRLWKAETGVSRFSSSRLPPFMLSTSLHS